MLTGQGSDEGSTASKGTSTTPKSNGVAENQAEAGKRPNDLQHAYSTVVEKKDASNGNLSATPNSTDTLLSVSNLNSNTTDQQDPLLGQTFDGSSTKRGTS